ncbi:hypothetical protein SGPA1_21076 [Streptomyces misionensis JCM 4497]
MDQRRAADLPAGQGAVGRGRRGHDAEGGLRHPDARRDQRVLRQRRAPGRSTLGVTRVRHSPTADKTAQDTATAETRALRRPDDDRRRARHSAPGQELRPAERAGRLGQAGQRHQCGHAVDAAVRGQHRQVDQTRAGRRHRAAEGAGRTRGVLPREPDPDEGQRPERRLRTEGSVHQGVPGPGPGPG